MARPALTWVNPAGVDCWLGSSAVAFLMRFNLKDGPIPPRS